ncbi:MAG: HAMP domain-containing sensor histidine kinase [Candidatus Devosia phytovorans]|uniref:histidine kinase n=1 Tax=Candidatus Devosia phytovorans TaxID=3121372 RepID=A0AAJ5VZ52_9HYPH|nr:HAMP domain-containing sensor histidine kinase [Devosia sp.]WEK06555.1 MAG: HAMP domain-containing sensor histidine kinase [Devosia sp.]
MRPWISRPFLVAALALTVLFVLLLTAVIRLAVNENRLSGEPAEGVIWFSSQGQYEAMRLADTILLYESGRIAHDDLVLRFDLLDSRLGLFEAGHLTRRIADMGYDDEVAALRTTLESHRVGLENMQPGDTTAVLELHEMAQSVAQTLRDLANAGMLDGRDRQESVRDGRRRILFEVLGYLLATLLAGVLVAIIVVRGLRTTVRAEAALQHEREISRLHRAFTSVVSHQFRTPLSIIDASAQRMLRRGSVMSPDEITNRVNKIRNACQRLTRLMESTLNAARLDQGEISFHARPSDLHQLITAVCESQPDEDQTRIVRSLDGLPRMAMVDTTLLEQAVQNLISNALKYSPSSRSILVRGGKWGDHVIIEVEDFGVGIPADELAFISERFFRARTAEGIAGTGIGLNFVLQIMNLHGGKLDIRSVEGKGSTFSLIFPHRQVDQEQTVAAHAE